MEWLTVSRPVRISLVVALTALIVVEVAIPRSVEPQDAPTQPPAARCGEVTANDATWDPAVVDAAVQQEAVSSNAVAETSPTGGPAAGDSDADDQAAANENSVAENDAMWDSTEGVPAEVEEERAISTAVEDLLACSNAGDPRRIYFLSTPDFLARRPPPVALPEPVPAPEEDRIGILWYEAVRLLDDGRATAFVWIADPTFSEENLLVGFALARDERGRWLLDDLVLLTDSSPVAYDLPALRQVRGLTDDLLDATPAATPTGWAQRKAALPPRGMATAPAETSAASVVDDFKEDGRANLTDTVVTGLLDLRGTTTDKFKATGVRFASGIVAGLIESSRAQAAADQEIAVHFVFTDVVFSGPVDLRWGRLNLECTGCIFEDVAIFHSVTANWLTFERSLFRDDAVFVNLDVETQLDLRDTRFRGAVDFTGADLPQKGAGIILTDMTTREPIQVAWSQFGDRWLDSLVDAAVDVDEETSGASKDALLRQIDADLRFWRQNFENIGRDRDARTVYRALVAFQQDHLMDRMGRDWWEAWFKGLGSAYGTDPYRPLWASGVVVLVFGLLYWVTGSFAVLKDDEVSRRREKPKFGLFRKPGAEGRSFGTKDLAFAVAYSVDTFVPFTVVTGVKDWGWQVTGWTRWAVVLERVLGAMFAALIVYNVGSYLI